MTSFLQKACTVFFLVMVFEGVFAIPAIPHQLYGAVTINGQSSPDGTFITTKVNGIENSSTVTSNGTYGYSPDSFFVTDPNGTNQGKDIVLFVNGIQAAEIVFSSGALTELNLAVTTSSPPPTEPQADPSTGSSGGGGGGGGSSSGSSGSASQNQPGEENNLPEVEGLTVLPDSGTGRPDFCANVSCNDNNPCTVDSCDTQNGNCVYSSLPNGSACLGGTCQEGKCIELALAQVPATGLVGLGSQSNSLLLIVGVLGLVATVVGIRRLEAKKKQAKN